MMTERRQAGPVKAEAAPAVVRVALQGSGGRSRNTWIVGSSDAVVVDPGPSEGAAELLRSLQAAHIQPSRVTHVLLTDLSPQAAGNCGLFPNAVVVAQGCGHAQALADTVGARRKEDDSWLALFDRMANRPASWAGADAPAGGMPSHQLAVVPWENGVVVRTPLGSWTGVGLPGVSAHSMAWMDSHGRLFGGESSNLDVEPTIRQMDAYLESLLVLTRLSPRQIFPGSGAANGAVAVAFRSLSLFANNLISNIQYALDGPRTVAELKFRDLGYLPDTQAEFAESCRTLEAALSALHAAGVATREADESGLYRYFIARPNRY